MDFKGFREKAKTAGLAVNQHEFKGKLFIFMFREGVLALPGGSEPLHRLLRFADENSYTLRKDIAEHHASERELEAGSTPVIWQPYEPPRENLDAIEHRARLRHSRGESGGDDHDDEFAPQGRIFLKDWLA